MSFWIGLGVMPSAHAQNGAPKVPDGPIGYLTDLEGKWGKVESFLAKSDQVLYQDADGRLQLRAGARFVYGGDAVDNGPDSIRVVNALVDLKERFPDRVTLIMGNRDLNKMLIPLEMTEAAMAGNTPRFEKWAKHVYGGPTKTLSPAQLKALDTKANRLRSVLRGAPDAFEFRRQELAKMEGRKISDEEVVGDFMREMEPGGRHRKFLELGQLVHAPTSNGHNSLFVHGAVSETSLGFVPGRAKRYAELTAWTRDLNDWYRANIAEWAKHPTDPKGLETFLGYQGPLPGSYANDDSVVYARYSDEPGNPVLPSPAVSDWLAQRGVAWVFGGHTPQDHIPSVLKGGRVNYVLGDNTYVPHGSVVELSPHGESVRIKSEFGGPEAGALANKMVEHSISLEDKSPIGKRLAGTSQLVKGRLSDGRWLATEILPGFVVKRVVLTDEEMRKRRLENPSAPPIDLAPPCAGPLRAVVAPTPRSTSL